IFAPYELTPHFSTPKYKGLAYWKPGVMRALEPSSAGIALTITNLRRMDCEQRLPYARACEWINARQLPLEFVADQSVDISFSCWRARQVSRSAAWPIAALCTAQRAEHAGSHVLSAFKEPQFRTPCLNTAIAFYSLEIASFRRCVRSSACTLASMFT